jgi:MFS family permease
VGFALAGGAVLIAIAFAAAGVGIGLIETAENAAVAAMAPAEVRGSAFGLLAAIQGFGQLAASAVAGLLWTLVSPEVAFVYLATLAAVAAVVITASASSKAAA